jgi:hypothetical protein
MSPNGNVCSREFLQTHSGSVMVRIDPRPPQVRALALPLPVRISRCTMVQYGYRREAYHGEPYATKVLVPEAFKTRPAAISAAKLEARLPVASGLDRASYSNLLVLPRPRLSTQSRWLLSPSRLEPALQENFQQAQHGNAKTLIYQ